MPKSNLRYAFFPGCTLESAAGELKIATERTCKKLGVELVEIDGWTCCGAAQIQDIDDFLGVAINARNIALAEAVGFDRILTVCNTCTLMLRTAKKRLDEDAELRAKVNEALAESGLEYRGTCEITHYLWMLVEDYGLGRLRDQVRQPLRDLSVANFYGCHILMPPDVMGFENPRNPRSMELVAGELKIATERTCKKLGVELVEIDGWTCCGAAQIQDIDDFLGVAINARNIALAEAVGFDRILTVCNTCTLMLRTAKKRLDEDAELRAKVNEALAESGLEYRGTCEITHYLWMLVEDYGLGRLRDQVRQPLRDLSVANFYGCHILMPPDVMGFENPRNPRSMELVAEALGANNVDFEQRLACCGFHSIYPAEREALLSNGVSCLTARDAGADCLVTPCPLCHMAIDMWQADAQKRYDADITMPILHLPQLVGLALGFTPKEMAVDRHLVRAKKMLEKKLA